MTCSSSVGLIDLRNQACPRIWAQSALAGSATTLEDLFSVFDEGPMCFWDLTARHHVWHFGRVGVHLTWNLHVLRTVCFCHISKLRFCLLLFSCSPSGASHFSFQGRTSSCEMTRLMLVVDPVYWLFGLRLVFLLLRDRSSLTLSATFPSAKLLTV